MEVTKIVDGKRVTFNLVGRLVTANAEEVRNILLPATDETDDILLDFTKLEFIASSGLRIILEIAKKMKQKNGKFAIKNVAPVVMDVLEMTGLSSIINIFKD